MCWRRTSERPSATSAHRVGEFALVLRVPKEAVSYIDEKAGDTPRTAFVRDVLAKGDAALAKILGA